jgi:hypothetical protein
MEQNCLFQKGSLRIYLQSLIATAEKDILALSEKDLAQDKIEPIVSRISTKCSLKIPVLLEGDMRMESSPTSIRIVANDDGYSRNKRQDTFIEGTKIKIIIPYTGTKELFFHRPNTNWQNFPQGDVVQNELQLTYYVRPGVHTTEQVEREYKNAVIGIKKLLSDVEKDIANHAQVLVNTINSALATRRAYFQTTQNFISELENKLKPKN